MRRRGRMLRRGGLTVLGLAFALAACTEGEPGAAPGATGAPATQPPPPNIAALESLGLPGEERADAPRSEALIGLDSEALGRLAGTPSLRRQEGPAEVWQYRVRDCVMDAYLYAGVNAGASAGAAPLHRVTYVEFRDGGLGVLDAGPARERCFADVLAAGRRSAAR